ncbi:hypothetical protein ACFODQ_04815, partial [Comamonas sp. JC664]
CRVHPDGHRMVQALQPAAGDCELTSPTSPMCAFRARGQGGRADAVSLINTINSVMGVNLDTLVMHPTPMARARTAATAPGSQPIAQNMVAEIARSANRWPADSALAASPLKDAAEYIALGCGTVQVCTAAMVYGFKIVQDMCDGLSHYMDAHGFKTIEDFQGRAVPTVRTGRT